uniref:Uncharacterized protein n=1 Tax=Trichuris muris TaxID=70415 RepID=A0A5S6QAN3_TRIMR
MRTAFGFLLRNDSPQLMVDRCSDIIVDEGPKPPVNERRGDWPRLSISSFATTVDRSANQRLPSIDIHSDDVTTRCYYVLTACIVQMTTTTGRLFDIQSAWDEKGVQQPRDPRPWAGERKRERESP